MDNAPKRADLDQIFDILLKHDNELAVLNAKLDELLTPVRRAAESGEMMRLAFHRKWMAPDTSVGEAE